MKITAKCLRSEGWWAVEVPEIAHLHTQARRLDQVDAMVRDAAAALTGEPEDSFEIDVVPDLSGDLCLIVKEAIVLADEARAAQSAASTATRAAASALSAEGLPLRDIGEILHVSHQRAAQLLAS